MAMPFSTTGSIDLFYHTRKDNKKDPSGWWAFAVMAIHRPPHLEKQ